MTLLYFVETIMEETPNKYTPSRCFAHINIQKQSLSCQVTNANFSANKNTIDFNESFWHWFNEEILLMTSTE